MTDPTPHPQPTPTAPPARPGQPRVDYVKIVEHSQLFYWWPVWAVGLVLFLLSYMVGGRMAVVPKNTTIERTANGEYLLRVNGAPPNRAGGAELPVGEHMQITEAAPPFGLHMAAQPYYGIIFSLTLLLVILITNVPLRGWASAFFILAVIALVVIISLAGWWQYIVDFFYFLDIHINAAGYLFLSLVLLALWGATVFFFDQQVYILFTPGQMQVHEQVGGGETTYDTTGMMTQHLRTDLFRHWILGLGSGDLIVRTAGAQSHEFRFSNVLFVGRKLQEIQELQREKKVVAG
jgi:hypothetical protein